MKLFGVYGRKGNEVTFFGLYSSEDAAKARLNEIRYLDLCPHEDDPIEFTIVPSIVDPSWADKLTWFL